MHLGIYVILSALVGAVSGWQYCYMCSGLGAASECETSPNDVTYGPGVVNCTNPYCTTVNVFLRATKKTPERVPHSIARLCDTVDKGNWCIYDDKFITCYSTCETDFCNVDVPNPDNLPKGKIIPISFFQGFTVQGKKSPSAVGGNLYSLHSGEDEDFALNDITSGTQQYIYEGGREGYRNSGQSRQKPSAELGRKPSFQNGGQIQDGAFKQSSAEKSFEASREDGQMKSVVGVHPKSEKWFIGRSGASHSLGSVTIIGLLFTCFLLF